MIVTCLTLFLINQVSLIKFQESPGGKKHKFVVTGHGKYEKVSVNQDGNDDANCQTGKKNQCIIHAAEMLGMKQLILGL